MSEEFSVAGLGLWHVDEGVSHWVLAADEEDAKLVVIENDLVLGPERRWHLDPPSVERLSVSDAGRVRFHDDVRGSISMGQAAINLGKRGYVACSEY